MAGRFGGDPRCAADDTVTSFRTTPGSTSTGSAGFGDGSLRRQRTKRRDQVLDVPLALVARRVEELAVELPLGTLKLSVIEPPRSVIR
jgi:hypothetical protein